MKIEVDDKLFFGTLCFVYNLLSFFKQYTNTVDFHRAPISSDSPQSNNS